MQNKNLQYVDFNESNGLNLPAYTVAVQNDKDVQEVSRKWCPRERPSPPPPRATRRGLECAHLPERGGLWSARVSRGYKRGLMCAQAVLRFANANQLQARIPHASRCGPTRWAMISSDAQGR